MPDTNNIKNLARYRVLVFQWLQSKANGLKILFSPFDRTANKSKKTRALVLLLNLLVGSHPVRAGTSDLTVIAWGLNTDGQTSVPIGAQHGVIAIAAGGYHTVALQSIPLILTQPADQLPLTGSDFTLNISATTASPPIRYQWQRNGIDLPGATNDSLILGNAQPANMGIYSVLVSDSLGSIQTQPAHVSLADATAPSVTTLAARNVGSNRAATLSGTVDPNGGQTSAYFEYGPGPDYGGSTPPVEVNLGAGTITLNQVLTGLARNTEYHFRMVARHRGGTNYGADLVFTIKSDARVVAWGKDDYGETNIPRAAQTGVTAIAGGFGHTVALKDDGSIFAWGYSNYGQTNVPAAGQSGVMAIAAGNLHTVALMTNGSVVAWGWNDYGQTTVPAEARNGVVAIAAGYAHTLALKSDGSVLAWGWNWEETTAVPAEAQRGVVAIAAGSNHNVALKQDGSVITWGSLGTRVPLSAMSGVVAIAAGFAHTVALKSDGSVIAWGNEDQGQAAVPVAAQSGVIAITVGDLHTVALKDDGSVVAWGNNDFGQSTVPLMAHSGMVAITAGSYHTVGLQSVPLLLSQPRGQSVPSGSELTLSVSAITPNPPLRYQWQRMGIDIAGATNKTFTLSSAHAADTGLYTVLVSDTVIVIPTTSEVARLDLTDPAVPSVTTMSASTLGGSGAVINGTVDPNGGLTTAYFEYGPSGDYGATTPPVAVELGAGSVIVNANITGLPRNSDYHFRLVARNSGGMSYGADQVFRTFNSDSRVMAWGYNIFGQSDVPMAAQSGVVAIAAGIDHTLALKTNGSVVAWGAYGSLQTTVPAEAQTGVTAIAAGWYSNVALRHDGSVIAWGWNGYGQTDVPSGAQSEVVAVMAGAGHTLALKEDGSVVAWGRNDYGQTTVPAAAQSGIVAIAAGSDHTVALKKDGSVVAWGRNDNRQATVPFEALSGVVAVAAGGDHTVALKGDGSVVAWGKDSDANTTVPVDARRGVMAIAAGIDHTLALKTNGSIVAWGYSSYGQTNVPVAAQSGIIAIAAGGYHTVALRSIPLILTQPADQLPLTGSDFTLNISATTAHSPIRYQWQRNGIDLPGATNDSLVLGNAQPANMGIYSVLVSDSLSSIQTQPAHVSLADATAPQVTTLAARNVGSNRAATLSGTVDPNGGETSAYFEYGPGPDYGASTPPVEVKLGAGTVTLSHVLTGAARNTEYHFRLVARHRGGTHYGTDQVFTIKSDARVMVWGKNDYGQTNVPTAVQSGVTAIAAGGGHIVALKDDGSIIEWGYSSPGQTNMHVAAQSGVVAIAAGTLHTVALMTDGSVVAWGWDQYGQIRVPWAARSGVMAIAAGSTHTVALKTNGSVVAWGNNDRSQTNVPVAAQSGVSAIAAGSGHTVALKHDGSVVAWGVNNYGQTNVPLAAQSGVIAVAAGADHTLALKHDGSVVAWGRNDYGQTKVPAAAQSGAIAIAAGYRHSLAVNTNGSVLAWGGNLDGETTVPAVSQAGVSAITAGYGRSAALLSIPFILSQPISQLVLYGSNATLTVSATTAYAPLRYQWQRNGTNIPGTTNSSLTITNAQTTNGGSYTVLVTDRVGSVRSTAATLTLIRAAAPSVTTLPATQISLHSAILNGTVNPTGSPTTARFEYGPTASYGSSSPPDELGNGTSAVPTSQFLTGLDLGTTYHFRLVASNSVGTSFGDDRTFTTTAALALLTPAWQTGQFSVSVSTENGGTYHLERKTSLSDPEWVRVASLFGNGQAQLLSDPGANYAQGFYRVAVE